MSKPGVFVEMVIEKEIYIYTCNRCSDMYTSCSSVPWTCSISNSQQMLETGIFRSIVNNTMVPRKIHENCCKVVCFQGPAMIYHVADQIRTTKSHSQKNSSQKNSACLRHEGTTLHWLKYCSFFAPETGKFWHNWVLDAVFFTDAIHRPWTNKSTSVAGTVQKMLD